MSSAHLFDPSKSIKFVKVSNSTDSSTTANNLNGLDGDEIRKFYETLISQPSTSSIIKREVKCEKLENVHIKTDVPKFRVKTEWTERDERLFFKAVELNDVDELIKYLKMGRNIHIKDFFGWTPLMCAASAGSLEAVELLVAHGADIGCSFNGVNAESLATKNKRTNVVNYFNKLRAEQTRKQGGEEADLIEEQYCALCNKSYFDSNHDTSIPHLVKLKEQPAEGWAYGLPVSNVGYRLLKQKAGWTEGEGLGKKKDGRKYPVPMALKRDRKGLGLEKPKMRVTHFESMDPNAVKLAKPPRRSYIRQRNKEIACMKEKEIQLRRLLS